MLVHDGSSSPRSLLWNLLHLMTSADSIRRLIRADSEHKDELEALLGVAEFAERQAGWRAELGAIEEGLLRRDLFVATPTLA